MADKPVELTVEEVPEQKLGGFGDVKILEEVLLSGEGRTRPFWFSEGTPVPAPGETVKGWWNTVKSGKNEGTRYFRRADDNTPSQRSPNGSSAAPRDDATGRSIERQVAYKEAAETLRAHYKDLSDEQYEAEALRLTDVGHRAIRGE